MKKLNITKEQFNRSKYFQDKYGKLDYISESGKVFKTTKNRILKFNESRLHSKYVEDEKMLGHSLDYIMYRYEPLDEYVKKGFQDCIRAMGYELKGGHLYKSEDGVPNCDPAYGSSQDTTIGYSNFACYWKKPYGRKALGAFLKEEYSDESKNKYKTDEIKGVREFLQVFDMEDLNKYINWENDAAEDNPKEVDEGILDGLKNAGHKAKVGVKRGWNTLNNYISEFGKGVKCEIWEDNDLNKAHPSDQKNEWSKYPNCVIKDASPAKAIYVIENLDGDEFMFQKGDFIHIRETQSGDGWRDQGTVIAVDNNLLTLKIDGDTSNDEINEETEVDANMKLEEVGNAEELVKSIVEQLSFGKASWEYDSKPNVFHVSNANGKWTVVVNTDEENKEEVSESKDDWFGIKNAKFVYHGDWADPEVIYDGVSLNYYDVESGLLDEYREEHPEDKNDEGFDKWMALPSTKPSIQSWLDDLVQAKAEAGELDDNEEER